MNKKTQQTRAFLAKLELDHEFIRGLVLRDIVDKSISLKERWDIFIRGQHLLESKDYIVRFKVIEALKLDACEHYYFLNRFERVDLMKFPEMFYTCADHGLEGEELDKLILELKEEILYKGYGYFTMDW